MAENFQKVMETCLHNPTPSAGPDMSALIMGNLTRTPKINFQNVLLSENTEFNINKDIVP